MICDAANGRGASWSRADVIVFTPSPGGPLYQVRASGGTPAAGDGAGYRDTAETAHRWPCFLPDGEHFLYAALPAGADGQYACYAGSIRSRERKLIVRANGAPLFAAPHFLLFLRGEVFVAQRFDPGALELSGDPFTVADLPGGTQYSGHPCASVSSNGVLAWLSAGNPDTRAYWCDRSGRELRALGIPQDRWVQATVAPDGQRAIFSQSLPSGDVDLWCVDLTREVANRITFGQGVNSFGSFSPDGRDILYTSTRKGDYQIYRRAADGSGSDQLFASPPAQFKYANAFSPDGKWVVLQVNGDQDGWNLLRVPSSSGEFTPYVVTPFDELNPQVSPDGKWCMYNSTESGTPQLYVQSFPEPGHKRQVTKTGGFYGVWGPGGREIILYQPDRSIVSMPVTPGPELGFGAPQLLFRFSPDWAWATPTPDDQQFLVLKQVAKGAPGISIAVNWNAATEP